MAVLYLIPITAGSAGLFLTEGLILHRRNKPNNTVRADSSDDKTV
ncbi:MAG TPA: hypothetical protein VLH35_06375 [Candidatus Acidoferrales bacterium]|nr:hypothetical protein [Candidatus Acidoferrales bacterium]